MQWQVHKNALSGFISVDSPVRFEKKILIQGYLSL